MSGTTWQPERVRRSRVLRGTRGFGPPFPASGRRGGSSVLPEHLVFLASGGPDVLGGLRSRSRAGATGHVASEAGPARQGTWSPRHPNQKGGRVILLPLLWGGAPDRDVGRHTPSLWNKCEITVCVVHTYTQRRVRDTRSGLRVLGSLFFRQALARPPGPSPSREGSRGKRISHNY